jgi:Nucleolar protein,Nop52
VNGTELIDYGALLSHRSHFPNSKMFSLRIDKYYMLVRRFVNVSFRFLIRVDWDKTVCDEYNSILSDTGGPLW